MMNLNKAELKVVLDLLNDKLEVINNGVASMPDAEFKAMVAEKKVLRKLQEKVFDALQPVVAEEDGSMFGV